MGPLDGIRVVELATYVAVPAAARVMADWGAEVIKIEAPTGDLWRKNGVNQGLPANDGANPIFSIPNSGKKMVCLDLKQEAGKQVLFRMLEEADVFCSNVRMAGIRRLGLDYETLHARFPRLVYLHFTGYGYEGPEADSPGFDVAAFWAMGGMMGDWPEEGGEPLKASSSFGDMTCASNVLSGILAAIIHRDRTGEGLRLTTSLYGSAIWYNYGNVIACQDGYRTIQLPPKRGGGRNPLAHAYRCRDGRWIFMAALQYDRLYERCMKTLELEQYVGDPRYATQAQMLEHGDELYQIVARQFEKYTVEEWIARLREADIVCQRLQTSNEVSKSEQAWANGYLTRVQFPDGQEMTEPNSPVQFFGCRRAETRAAGPIGGDTRDVLGQLGYSQAEIDGFFESGAAAGK